MTTHWVKGGSHPDLDEAGNLQADALFDHSGDVRTRDLNRRLRDPTQRDHFLGQVAREQAELPTEVQRYVQGRTYDAATPAEGYAAYQQERAWALQNWAQQLGYERVVTDADVARMDLQEYDRAFDEKGQPRQGILVWKTSRSHAIDDSMDAASRGELRNIRGSR